MDVPRERVTYGDGRRQVWRVVGWRSFTGEFRPLADPESDPGRSNGFAPLWQLYEDEPLPETE